MHVCYFFFLIYFLFFKYLIISCTDPIGTKPKNRFINLYPKGRLKWFIFNLYPGTQLIYFFFLRPDVGLNWYTYNGIDPCKQDIICIDTVTSENLSCLPNIFSYHLLTRVPPLRKLFGNKIVNLFEGSLNRYLVIACTQKWTNTRYKW